MKINSFTSKFLTFAVPLALTILHSGVWFIPNLGNSLLIIQNPFTSPPMGPEGQYIFSSWLFHFVAFVLGANGYISLIALSAFFAALFFLVVILEIKRTVSERNFNKSVFLFCLTPASFTGFYWLGMDSLTLLLLALILRYKKKPTLVVLFSILLGMQHFEQGAVALFLFTLTEIIFQHRTALITNLYSLAGVVTGKLLFEGLMVTLDVKYQGRFEWFGSHLGFLFQSAFLNFPLIFWSLFGLLWLVIIKLFSERLTWRKILVPICLTLAFAFFAADQTRVMAIISFPYVLKYLVTNEDVLNQVPNLKNRVMAAILLISPVVWVWGGVDRGGLLFKDIAFFFGYFLHFFPIPNEFSLWPFV